MIAEKLLEKIEFTEKMQAYYAQYQELLKDSLKPYAKAYMQEELSLQQAADKIHLLKNEQISEYTIDLMFLLNCTGELQEKYRQAGIAEEHFINAMKDIRYKTEECMRCKGVFGTFVIDWFDGFFRLTRFALGRLQYDVAEHHGDIFKVGDYEICDGDFLLGCHIPSAGSLRHELCEASYHMAYTFFKDRLKDGILPIFCHSWLLYPPYQNVFGKTSNTAEFRRDFKIFASEVQEQFHDCWRVFGTDDYSEPDKLPTKTGLQKSFAEYIKAGGEFGAGNGVILFDGTHILTRE